MRIRLEDISFMAKKHLSKIIVLLLAVAVVLCFVSMAYTGKYKEKNGLQTVKQEYETKLFNTDEVINIDIRMDAEEWDSMLENAMSEEYYVCDVDINGKTLEYVGIRPKGNTSLSAIAMNSETDRYSLKLEFDHYVDDQTCFGLDKLILNNNYADATNMKEAIIYDMFQYLGATASLYNYAKVSVNGEYWGVYLALEGVEESFMARNFGTKKGYLYKPDSMEMGGGDKSAEGGDGGGPGGGPTPGDFPGGDLPEGGPGGGMPGGKGGPPEGFTMGGNGANLNYVDDDLDSYSTIWDGDITGANTSDKRRVVEALKNISEGNDIEKYLDVDNVLKYMAAHTFSVNMDSLSGSMAHNYYLYESAGQLNIFPWDYNLSLGGMDMGSSGDATDMINDAIDTPFDGTDFFDPLLENEEYLARYHEYLQKLVDEYVNGGRFDEVYNGIRSRIDELVKTDPTAFYNYEESDAAAQMLYKTIKLRAESIDGQLKGTIPSTDEGQQQDSSSFVDGSEIDVKTMGEFNMGGVDGGFKQRGHR